MTRHHFPAAAALLSLAVFSNAANALVLNTVGGDASLALVVYNASLSATNTDGRAYTRDLGVSFSEWNDTLWKAKQDATTLPGFASDPNWAEFKTLSQAADPNYLSNLVVQIVSWNQSAAGFNLLGTDVDGTATIRNVNFSKAFAPVSNFYSQLNILGIPDGGSIITSSANGVGYPASTSPISIRRRYGTNFDANLGGALNTELQFHNYTYNVEELFADSSFYGTLKLGQDGALSFTSAIPEPGTWALLVAGLAGLGMAVRRRPSA